MENEFTVLQKLKFVLNRVYLLFALCVVFSCKNEPECTDIDFGRQYMSESTKSSFAYAGGETLIFIDSNSKELSFSIIPIYEIKPSWLSLAQDVLEGTCAGEVKIRCSLQQLAVNFNSDSLDYKIIYLHGVNSRIQGMAPICSDYMSSDMIQGNQSSANWHISTSHLLDPKGNEAYFADIPISYEYTELITLNGKTFEKVYFNKLSDGSAIYFNHELGFVGFKERNQPLWVLDRIE